MNTWFNLRGEAIVYTPTDALRTFFSSGMDALCNRKLPQRKMTAQRVIALLGRRDEPTDAVEEYCHHLGAALVAHDFQLDIRRVPWNQHGWRGSGSTPCDYKRNRGKAYGFWCSTPHLPGRRAVFPVESFACSAFFANRARVSRLCFMT